MAGCCDSKKNSNNSKDIGFTVNNLKSSIFCGTKGFLTFSLALLSYLEYSLYDSTVHTSQKENTYKDNKQKKVKLALGCAVRVDGSCATKEKQEIELVIQKALNVKQILKDANQKFEKIIFKPRDFNIKSEE